ncbi:DUF2971 domain-containing protein [Rhizobium jaguaris]|uniref:DUF2971 domain-containing protein n=1 Tax=Rhizobium jaguaris TaxID=1312183 RepID=UPI0039BF3769
MQDDTIDRELQAIEDAFVYCPRFSDMNDPMEGAHRTSLGSILRGSRAGLEDIAEARNDLGIASLSEVHDHEPMWAHYAGQFSGICIMFSTRKLLAGLDDDIDLIRMAYNEKPPILASQKASVSDKAKLTLATKTVRWASEREWRIIAPLVGKAEYVDPAAVIRVYLGSRIWKKAYHDVMNIDADPAMSVDEVAKIDTSVMTPSIGNLVDHLKAIVAEVVQRNNVLKKIIDEGVPVQTVDASESPDSEEVIGALAIWLRDTEDGPFKLDAVGLRVSGKTPPGTRVMSATLFGALKTFTDGHELRRKARKARDH